MMSGTALALTLISVPPPQAAQTPQASAPASASAQEDPHLAAEKIFEGFGLAIHPSLESCCGEEPPYGDKGGLATTYSFHSSLSPPELVGFFRETLGDQGFTPTAGGGTWRLKGSAPDRHIVLDILTVGEQLSMRCDSPTPEEARSVVLLSIQLKP
jgi:hypothetical protein